MRRGEIYHTRERVLEEGPPRTCAIRCDFLTLMFKSKLTHFMTTLSEIKLAQLNRALAHALELPPAPRPVVSSR